MSTTQERVAEAYERALASTQPAWTSLVPWEDVRARLDALRDAPAGLPLHGVPFAIKDNIDLEGVPTTAACAVLDHRPARSAFVVSRLIAAVANWSMFVLPMGIAPAAIRRETTNALRAGR